jgi:NAD(P)H-flavin reductase
MASIEFGGRRIELEGAETVLDGLLRSGIDAPHSCRAGHCRTCLVRALDGDAPPGSQTGLKEAWRERGLFLACRAVPVRDLRVGTIEDLGLDVPATVIDVARLSHDVVRVRLRAEAGFAYRGGQYLVLVRDDGLARSYSTASLPGRDEFIELHVREIAGGVMSRWLAREVAPGARVALRGPDGECFYVPGRPEQNLLLAGTGTGLAPLHAILQEALRQGHTGRIVLLQGALEPRGLYLVEELLALAAVHHNFEYLRCLVTGDAGPGVEVGALERILAARIPSLAGWRTFLCGNPELVFALRKKVFLAGGSMQEIHADAFVMRPAVKPVAV